MSDSFWWSRIGEHAMCYSQIVGKSIMENNQFILLYKYPGGYKRKLIGNKICLLGTKQKENRKEPYGKHIFIS